MKARSVSFREIEDAHRKERAGDAAALRSGEVSARELQERNSIIPAGASIQIVDLAAYVRKRERKQD
jgi:hypothetical protein